MFRYSASLVRRLIAPSARPCRRGLAAFDLFDLFDFRNDDFQEKRGVFDFRKIIKHALRRRSMSCPVEHQVRGASEQMSRALCLSRALRISHASFSFKSTVAGQKGPFQWRLVSHSD